MKIHILYDFKDQPWGGGNQFLRALRKELKTQGVYEENPEKADAVLFNSYPFGVEYLFDQILRLKQKDPNKIIIYRLDGPISLIRGRDKEIDEIIALFNNLFVDGVIFQSEWCREQNKKHFNILSKYEMVIHNAPDNQIFNKDGKQKFNPKEKIKLIATSWSPNWRKGFEIYKYLDENLDFSKYEVTFVGSSPIKFKNIKWIKPVPSEKLADILEEHDIFVTASKNDPCSNSLIEALSCGLPAVALNDGGHPELVGNGGELFEGKNDVMGKIEKVVPNYSHYQSKIREFSINEVAKEYCGFAEKIYSDVQNERYEPKQVSFFVRVKFYKMKLMVLRWKVKNKLGVTRKRIWKT